MNKNTDKEKGQNSCTEIATLVVAVEGKQPTLAEFLLDTARAIHRPKGKLIKILGGALVNDVTLARLVLAQDFAKLPRATHLQAIIEEWGHQRIMLETYR